MKNKLSRRNFLWLTGGTGATVLFRSGEKAINEFIPYVNAPEYPAPGEWAHLSTTCRECPAGCGLLMTYRDGRVTKAEGNPNHEISRGKLCIRGQSSIQGLYDRDRLKQIWRKDEQGQFVASNREDAFRKLRTELATAGKVLLMSDLQTGSLAGVMEDFAAHYGSKPVYYEALNYESMRRANEEMYGEPLVPHYRFDDADLIVSFGVDFLETWLSPVEHARQFSDFHSLREGHIGKMIYLGAVETMTAINADEFICIDPGTEANLIYALITRLQEKGVLQEAPFDVPQSPLSPEDRKIVEQLTACLARAKAPLILAGRPEDTTVAGIDTVKAANLLNNLLGSAGRIDFSASHALSKTAYKSEVNDFFSSIGDDTVVVIHQANPVYSEAGIAEHLQRARKIIYLGTMKNETAALADWLFPVHYSLEDWGDFEAQKDFVSVMQPVMHPVYPTLSAGDLFLRLNGQNGKTFKEVVRSNWKRSIHVEKPEMPASRQEKGFDSRFYEDVLKKGFFRREKKEQTFLPRSSGWRIPETPVPLEENVFYLQLLPSLFFYDGRLANRGWLHEIPHPVSNIAWQSWVDIHTERAKSLNIADGDVLTLTTETITLEVVARLTSHISSQTAGIEIGRGHWGMGRIADHVGINAFSLQNPQYYQAMPRVMIEKTGKSDPPLYLHPTLDQRSRELLRHEELEKLQNGTAVKEPISWPLPEGYRKESDLYRGHEHQKHRWGMVIDLQSCIGCKACEAACYAENNIPVVGRKNAAEGREMSWLKVVPYSDNKQKTAYLPTPCQHCDAAPCEPVCPVYASVHSEDGLNAQIYNRCIGTRYCSNNCPYKVRRFNWSNIRYEFPENLRLNPEVTVRSRGVMEKCTFCVQRIRNKQHQAKTEHRELQDGEIVPACAQTCPANAIVFGDLMDENSAVRKLANNDRSYQLLHELNTKPAVIYLKKIDQNS